MFRVVRVEHDRDVKLHFQSGRMHRTTHEARQEILENFRSFGAIWTDFCPRMTVEPTEVRFWADDAFRCAYVIIDRHDEQIVLQ